MKKLLNSSRRYAKYQEKRAEENINKPDSWTINEKEIDCDLFNKNKNKCLTCENKYNITFCMGM
jgi:hypothetical protein